jgi:hypothetical protein
MPHPATSVRRRPACSRPPRRPPARRSGARSARAYALWLCLCRETRPVRCTITEAAACERSEIGAASSGQDVDAVEPPATKAAVQDTISSRIDRVSRALGARSPRVGCELLAAGAPSRRAPAERRKRSRLALSLYGAVRVRPDQTAAAPGCCGLRWMAMTDPRLRAVSVGRPAPVAIRHLVIKGAKGSRSQYMHRGTFPGPLARPERYPFAATTGGRDSWLPPRRVASVGREPDASAPSSAHAQHRYCRCANVPARQRSVGRWRATEASTGEPVLSSGRQPARAPAVMRERWAKLREDRSGPSSRPELRLSSWSGGRRPIARGRRHYATSRTGKCPVSSAGARARWINPHPAAARPLVTTYSPRDIDDGAAGFSDLGLPDWAPLISLITTPRSSWSQ